MSSTSSAVVKLHFPPHEAEAPATSFLGFRVGSDHRGQSGLDNCLPRIQLPSGTADVNWDLIFNSVPNGTPNGCQLSDKIADPSTELS